MCRPKSLRNPQVVLIYIRQLKFLVMASFKMSIATTVTIAAFVLFLNIQSGESLHCWDCNSAYDPRCGDPFDNHSIALVDCSQMSYSHLSVKEATLCRKTTQRVQGKLRVVRSCGWLNSTHEDDGRSCFQRSGSQDVYLTHCTCFGDGCNGTSALVPQTAAFVILSILMATLLVKKSSL